MSEMTDEIKKRLLETPEGVPTWSDFYFLMAQVDALEKQLDQEEKAHMEEVAMLITKLREAEKQLQIAKEALEFYAVRDIDLLTEIVGATINHGNTYEAMTKHTVVARDALERMGKP